MLQNEKYAKIIRSLNYKNYKKQRKMQLSHNAKIHYVTKKLTLCAMLRENKLTILQAIQILGGIIYYAIRIFIG